MTRRLSTQFTLCGTFLTPPLVPRSQRRVKQLITQPSQLTGAGPFSLLVPSLIKRRLCFSTIGTLHYLFVVILHFFFLFMPLLFYSPTQPWTLSWTDRRYKFDCVPGAIVFRVMMLPIYLCRNLFMRRRLLIGRCRLVLSVSCFHHHGYLTEVFQNRGRPHRGQPPRGSFKPEIHYR